MKNTTDKIDRKPDFVKDAVLSIMREDGRLVVYRVMPYIQSNSVSESDLIEAIEEHDFNAKRVA